MSRVRTAKDMASAVLGIQGQGIPREGVLSGQIIFAKSHAQSKTRTPDSFTGMIGGARRAEDRL